MTSFRRFAFISTVATYFLIFMGGLVRVSGAGLGCPDWPKCFGRWIPPLHAGQLPPDIDPATFNITLAWIEYVNRLVGVTVGFLILIAAIFAVKQYRTIPKIVYTTLAVLALVGFQGWYGGQVVTSELLPITVTIHLLLTFVIIGLLIYVTQQAFYLEKPESDTGTVYPLNAEKWIWMLAAATVVQIIFGTQIRSSVEIMQARFPVLTGRELLDLVGAVQNVHWVLGIVMFFISWYSGAKILKSSERLPLLVRQSTWAMMVLIIVQLFLGLIITAAGLPELAQLSHLWVASLYFGMVIIIMTALRRQSGGKNAVTEHI